MATLPARFSLHESIAGWLARISARSKYSSLSRPIACSPGNPGSAGLPLRAQWSKARANLFYKEFRLFPGRIVPAFIEFAVIDKFVIGPLGPTPRRFIVLARKDAHGSRD